MRFGNMISAVDAHAAGEPGRVIIGGVFDVPGKTMFEKKVYLETKADGLRKRMLRDHAGLANEINRYNEYAAMGFNFPIRTETTQARTHIRR